MSEQGTVEPQTKLLQDIYTELQSMHRELAELRKLTGKISQCGNCRGTGSVMTPLGQDECPKCQGTGLKS